MKELIDYIVRALVAHPDRVDVREVEDEKGPVVELRVDPEDMGVVIGRRGRTATALRTLMAAATPKGVPTPALEILD